MTNLKKEIKWSASGQITSQLITIVGSTVLARLLSPDDFGTLAMVIIISSFASMFLDAGFSLALIQKKEINNTLMSSVFWLNNFIACLLTGLLIVFAPYISKFYQKEILEELCYIISFLFLLNSLSQIHRVLLSRKMDFKTLAIQQIVGLLLSYISAIVMAYNDLGIWSLVAQVLITPLFSTIFLWLKVKWTPTNQFSFKSIASIANFSLSTFFNGMLEYWIQNLDGVLLGKKMGAYEMGIYSRSFSSILIPVRAISSSFNSTLYPKFAQLQTEKEEFKKLYLKSIRVQAFLSIPSVTLLAILSYQIISVLFGEKWLDMVPIIRILAVLGFISTTFATNDSCISAMGKANLLLKVGLIEKPILIIGTIIGIQYGLTGIAYAKLISVIIVAIPKYWLFIKVTQIKLTNQFKQYTKIFVATIFMTAILLTSYTFNSHYSSQLLSLTINSLIGVSSYLLACYILKEPVFHELFKELKKIKL